MTNTNRPAILATEITAHIEIDRALRVGDLAVFTDYKGRTIPCTIVEVFAPGAVDIEAHLKCRTMREAPAPYGGGMTFTLPAVDFRRAV